MSSKGPQSPSMPAPVAPGGPAPSAPSAAAPPPPRAPSAAAPVPPQRALGKDIPKSLVKRIVADKKTLCASMDKVVESLVDNSVGKLKSKWTLILESGNTKVYEPTQKTKPYCEYRAVSEYKNKTARQVYSFLRDFSHRSKWDLNVDTHERLAKIVIDRKMDEGDDVTYTRTKPIAAGVISSRSYLNVRRGAYQPKTGYYIEVAQSVDEKKYAVPERTDGSVVATLFPGSGGVFEPTDGGKSCKLHYITYTDAGGWLPYAAVLRVMPGELAGYFNLIKSVIDGKTLVNGKPVRYKLLPDPTTAGKQEKKEKE